MKSSETKFDADDPRLSAYALGELEGEERAEIEALLAESEAARHLVNELRSTADEFSRELGGEPSLGLTLEQRTAIEQRAQVAGSEATAPLGRKGRLIRQRVGWLVAAGVVLAAGAWLVVDVAREKRTSLFGAREERFAAAPAGSSVEVARGMEPNLHRYTSSQSVPMNKPAYTWIDAATTASAPGDRGAETVAPQRGGYVVGKLADLRDPASASRLSSESVSLDDLEQEKGGFNTEAYNAIVENVFKLATADPLSTFSIDVDTASYSNVRRFLNQGQLPPADAVRIEELVNYFRYRYAAPSGDQPFSVTTHVASCPWAPSHRLVHVGLRGREIAQGQNIPANLVFLIDVSGSMNEPSKLPLLQRSMRLLVEALDARDRVALVVYAGNSGVVLPSTTCDYKSVIMSAIDRLQAGGSTNGAAGIELAYKIAAENFQKEGQNRVILCTDGDFNVGVTDQGSLVRMIEEKRKSGVFLSVLGFGTGNTKDSTMEMLADKGNGNYAYIDNLNEARKVLVNQMGGTLFTIAKDVKIQIELNPREVQAWRLIGYENRLLAHQDFNDDAKDAGEIGAGATVTALYEIVPVGVPFTVPGVDPLKYQVNAQPSGEAFNGELLTLKLRYKAPDGDTSQLITTPVRDSHAGWEQAGEDFKFSAAVAAFGMILRKSPNAGDMTMAQVQNLATMGTGEDPEGYRREFVELVTKAQNIK